MSIIVSPDCRDQNHQKCPGDAWDEPHDHSAACGCVCHAAATIGTQRDDLAVLIAKHHDAFFGVEYAKPAVQDFGLADEILAAGWEKPSGDSFQLQASLTSGEIVTVKVSGYSNLRQGCAALVKVADVQTLSQVIAGSEEQDGDWS